MVSLGWLLFFTSLFYTALCDLNRYEAITLNGNKDLQNVLSHSYRFPSSSDVASQLVSTSMAFYTDLQSLVERHVASTKYGGESTREECFRRMAELPWVATIGSTLASHLTAMLDDLIKKDAGFSEQLAKTCGTQDQECTDTLKSRLDKEIDYFGTREMYNFARIKAEYLKNIEDKLNTCLVTLHPR